MDVYEYGDKSASTVLIQPVDDHDLSVIENEVRLIGEKSGGDFLLKAVKVDSWNNDLSPWQAPAVFGGEAFGGRAEETLKMIKELCPDSSRKYIIGGYSLAGLFALWAVYKTDIFSGAAAASPSVWFPGFTDYLKAHEPKCEAIYLSLGDREEKTKNRTMAAVGDCIREDIGIIKAQGLRCILEWNSGNHFKDPDIRTAKAFSWLMSEV